MIDTKMILAEIQGHLQSVAEHMADDMRAHLTDGGHIDTGQLINSIHVTTGRTADTIDAYVNIDAENNGTWYAEFLEYGTGIYNETGDGRTTPWRYKDRHGNWHTTQGMKADPFIRPSYAAHLGELEDRIRSTMGNLKRYKK